MCFPALAVLTQRCDSAPSVPKRMQVGWGTVLLPACSCPRASASLSSASRWLHLPPDRHSSLLAVREKDMLAACLSPSASRSVGRSASDVAAPHSPPGARLGAVSCSPHRHCSPRSISPHQGCARRFFTAPAHTAHSMHAPGPSVRVFFTPTSFARRGVGGIAQRGVALQKRTRCVVGGLCNAWCQRLGCPCPPRRHLPSSSLLHRPSSAAP